MIPRVNNPQFWRLVFQAICADAENRYPLEACGLVLASHFEVVPLRNVRESSHAFAFDDLEFLSVLNQLDSTDQRLVAIYHSHPDGKAELSSIDRESFAPQGEAWFPDALQIVIGVLDKRALDLGVYRWSSDYRTYLKDESITAAFDA